MDLKIPIFVYHDDAKQWAFDQQSKPLVLPKHLKFQSIIVEGKLRTGSLGIPASLPDKYKDLSPDIIIFLDGKDMIIIETKTVGALIGDKELLYFGLCEWLKKQGINAETYILLSAGHQPNSDIIRLKGMSKEGVKLILWEQFFKEIEKQVQVPFISRLFPTLSRYYQPEADYLSGNF